ncbi:MAG: glycosyl hydrolase family 18 protein [Bacteroidota bacterium]
MFLVFVLFIQNNIFFGQEHFSVHQSQKEYYDSFGYLTNEEYNQLNGFQMMPKQKVNPNCPLNRVVFGWHPYWVGTTYYNYQWDYLSDLSFFSYEVNPSTGNASTTHGWESSAVIDSAQAHGVRVNLCVTLFSSHATFFGNPTARQTLISNLISLVQLRNANGVNIDFEGVSSSLSTDLTNFMIDLCNQMHTAIPGSQVSICTYAVDWSGLFDLATLNNYVDYFTIMGYAYYYSGSATAGPTAPLYSLTSSYNYNLSKTLTYYLSNGASKEKIILGLPYYGYEWNTSTSTVPSSTTGGVGSRTYKYVRDNSSTYSNRQWESNSFTPYYVYYTTNWRQCFVDDEISLGYRYDLVNRRDIAGIGIWALGYDDGYNDLWNLLKEKFTGCGTVPCSENIYDMGGPAFAHYSNEQYTYTIAPTNATGLSMTFNSFELESGYDSLWLYNGYNTSAPLIGGYSGLNSPGTVNANSGAITISFYSDVSTNLSGWDAEYNCTIDNIKPETYIDAGNWETNDFTATFTDIDNSAVDHRFYQVLDWNGSEWRGNGDFGFINDNFETSLHTEWTNILGTWQILNQHLNQSDEAVTNSNLYINANQDSGYIYMYHWQMSIGGTGTNRRAGLHFCCDDPTMTQRNNSYMVYFRVDQNKCQIYKAVNDAITIYTDDLCSVDANVWYDYKVIFNSHTGEIKAYQNDVLVSSWTDSTPLKLGNSLSLRTGNCNVLYDDVKIYKSRTINETVTIGDISKEVRFQNPDPTTPACRLKSMITDIVGNFSLPGTLNVNIDWTIPSSPGFINDGPAADMDTTTSATQLSANWGNSIDTNSGISKYWYAIGSSAGDSDIVAWADNSSNLFVTHTSLSLTVGNTYFFSVRAEDGAGLLSSITSSDGIFVMNPSSAPVADFSYNSDSVCSGEHIQFFNSSINGSSCTWFFEGGIPSASASDNPVIVYGSPGNFDVTLISQNSFGTDTAFFSDLISVIQSPVADFTAVPVYGAPPLIVTFANNSIGSSSYYWLFGDGANSTDHNPYHIYTTEGIYSVMLTAISNLCGDSTYLCQDCIVVENPSGYDTIDNGNTIKIFPNPVNSWIYFSKKSYVELYTVDMKHILSINYNKLDMSKFEAGVYFVKCNNQYFKIIKN